MEDTEKTTPDFENDNTVGGGFYNEDHDEILEQWEKARQQTKTGAGMLKQQDIKFSTPDNPGRAIRLVENRFYHAWIHVVNIGTSSDEEWKRVVCCGKKEILEDPNNSPALDPENCPICEWALSKGNARHYPQSKFYYRIIDREYQAEQLAAGLPNVVRVFETGAKIWGLITKIATIPQYMAKVRDADGKVVIDERTKQPKLAVNLTGYDLLISKEKKKNYKEAKDVEYMVNTIPSEPLSDEERALELPSMDGYIDPTHSRNQEKITEILNVVRKRSGVEDEPRRESRVHKTEDPAAF